MTSLESRIKAVLDDRSLLKHPFYQAWTAGTLDLDQLRDYARQYYHFEAAFPRFLSAIHARTDSPRIRQLLLENLWDEEHGERNHPALWLEFTAALGLSAKEVVNSRPNPQTAALIAHFNNESQHAPLAEAMATLFAYEGQVPGIAWQKIKGLSEHYSFKPEQFEFFSVHLVTDVAHAGAEMESINASCEDEDAVVAAARAACDRLHTFLDGCYAPAGVR